MVIVSICINIFFLLMGILIGKDDLKWEEQQLAAQSAPPPVTTREAVDLDDELSVFEQQETRAPVDVTPVEEHFEEPEPERVVQQTEPEPVRAEPREVAPPTKEDLATAKSGYWVQVLAAKEVDKANQFRDRMRKDGYEASVLAEGGYYKVRVGPFTDRKQADRTKETVNTRYKVKSWVRSN